MSWYASSELRSCHCRPLITCRPAAEDEQVWLKIGAFDLISVPFLTGGQFRPSWGESPPSLLHIFLAPDSKDLLRAGCRHQLLSRRTRNVRLCAAFFRGGSSRRELTTGCGRELIVDVEFVVGFSSTFRVSIYCRSDRRSHRVVVFIPTRSVFPLF